MCNNLEEQMQSMENKQMVLIQLTPKKVYLNNLLIYNKKQSRTPAICKISHYNQTMPTLVLDLEGPSMFCYLALVEKH